MHEVTFLSETERTQERLNAIADQGGCVGGLVDGFAQVRGEPWSAHGYKAVWVATEGVGNSGALFLTAEPGTAQAERLEAGQRKLLQDMLAEAGGPENVLRAHKGCIYQGRERPYPERLRLCADWGAVTKTKVAFPSTNYRTRVVLVPLSTEAQLIYEHAQYERVLDEIERVMGEEPGRYRTCGLPTLWKLVQLGRNSDIRATDEILVAAALSYSIPDLAWDRSPPTSNKGCEAWAERWGGRLARYVNDWPRVRELVMRAKMTAQ